MLGIYHKKPKPKERIKVFKAVQKILERHICLGLEGEWDYIVGIPTLADDNIFETLESLIVAREKFYNFFEWEEKGRDDRKNDKKEMELDSEDYREIETSEVERNCGSFHKKSNLESEKERGKRGGRGREKKRKVAIVILLNEPENSYNLKSKNLILFERLKVFSHKKGEGIFVKWVQDVPSDLAGAGFARRILMDEAICVFTKEFLRMENKKSSKNSFVEEDEHENFKFFEFLQSKLIFSLDSDSPVSEDYFLSAFSLFERKEVGCGVYLFKHIFSDDKDERKAGMLWELFLRYWRDSLRTFEYPFAFYPIGSLFVVRAGTYAISGGMNIRKAGEDFYFLQKLFGLTKIKDIPTYVYPKAYAVQRTPFGTGKEISLYVSGQKERLEYVWNFESFRVLKYVIHSSAEIVRKVLSLEIEELPKIDGINLNIQAQSPLNHVKSEDIQEGSSGENFTFPSTSHNFTHIDIFLAFLRENPKFFYQLKNSAQNELGGGKESSESYASDTKCKEIFLKWFLPFKVFKFLRFCERIFPKDKIESEVRKLISEIEKKTSFDFSGDIKAEEEKISWKGETCEKNEISQKSEIESEESRSDIDFMLEYLRKFDHFISLLDYLFP